MISIGSYNPESFYRQTISRSNHLTVPFNHITVVFCEMTVIRPWQFNDFLQYNELHENKTKASDKTRKYMSIWQKILPELDWELAKGIRTKTLNKIRTKKTNSSRKHKNSRPLRTYSRRTEKITVMRCIVALERATTTINFSTQVSDKTKIHATALEHMGKTITKKSRTWCGGVYSMLECIFQDFE